MPDGIIEANYFKDVFAKLAEAFNINSSGEELTSSKGLGDPLGMLRHRLLLSHFGSPYRFLLDRGHSENWRMVRKIQFVASSNAGHSA